MNYFVIFIVIGLSVLYVFSSKKKKTSKKIKPASSSKPRRISVPSVLKEQRRYMAETVPVLLDDYKVLNGCYYSRFAAEYLRTGHTASFLEGDVVEGVEPGHASWVLNHCLQLASARYSAISKIKSAADAEARYIKFDVFRPNPECSLVPKSQKFKVGSNIPVYPCADCKENNICVFFYDLEW